MIYKSFLIENNINEIKENLILFYGENLGLKNDFKKKIKNSKDKNIIVFNQDNIIANSGLLYNEISNISLFEKNKVFIIELVTDKILASIEEIIPKINNETIYLFADVLDKKSKYLYLVGFSINENDYIKINLYKNFLNEFIDVLINVAKFLFIFSFYKYFFLFNKIDKKEYVIFFSAIISTLIFILLKDLNLITGLRYFRGGADGLFHESSGYKIVKDLYNFNFTKALRGGEDIFYFMPGLRYFIAFNKIIFGETNYGYVLISAFLPIFIFKFFKNIFSSNISFYLALSFMFFPIFENMGFGHFNYVGQVARNHAETLSIFLIVYSLYKITELNLEPKNSHFLIFYVALLLAFSAFCRPNFLPTTTIIFLYLSMKLFYRNKLLIISAIIGYSFIFSSLLHNIYFGNEFVLFTKSSVHFIFNNSYELVNAINFNHKYIIDQFFKWNPLYNIHRIVILIFIFYGILKYKNNSMINMLFICMIFQHIVLILTHPDSRYAYLAWLLTFIVFVYLFEKIFLNKFKHFRNTF